MFTVQEFSEAAQALLQKQEELQEQFLKALTQEPEEVMLEAQKSFSFSEELSDSLYVLSEGSVTVSLAGKGIFYLNEGDFFAFPLYAHVADACIETDFAVSVKCYSLAAIASTCESSEALATLWSDLRNTHAALLFQLLVDNSKLESNVQPSIQYFSEGDSIIEQGAVADKVYTLLEGEANVFHAGVQVGTVIEDEIFGALAALTANTRTASVVAAKRCAVAALPAADFRSLIESRPHTTEKLIKDFARKIVELNNPPIMTTATG